MKVEFAEQCERRLLPAEKKTLSRCAKKLFLFRCALIAYGFRKVIHSIILSGTTKSVSHLCSTNSTQRGGDVNCMVYGLYNVWPNLLYVLYVLYGDTVGAGQ